MGWTGHELPKPGWFLHTRGGSQGVYIQKKTEDGELLSEEIEIPSEMIRMLVAEEIKSQKIRELEQMGTEEILKTV